MTFASVLDDYMRRIHAREPFAMYRFADGELMLVDGVAVGSNTQASRVDRWEAPSGMTALGRDLRTVLETQEACTHFGIPCPCCDMNGYTRLRSAIQRAPVFPVNLFINANYKRFQQFLHELPEVALVSNVRARVDRMPFSVTQWMQIPDNVVVEYEANRLEILARARDFCRKLHRSIVFVAAGPLSEVLIFTMWNANPNNTYVDVGSSLDEFSHGQKTRPYMFEGNEYAMRQCALPEDPPVADDLHASRFVHQNDARVTNVFAGLPEVWWSRGHEYAWAMNFASPEHTVLDAACGMCHPFKMWLASQGCNTFACDLDPGITNNEAILAEVVKHLGTAAALQVRTSGILHAVKRSYADISALPYSNMTFDRVFCISVLEHVPSEIRHKCLQEFSRVLKPGGLAVITLDVPPISPEEFQRDVAQCGDLEFVSTFDPVLPVNALHGSPPGYGLLRCFRALLRKR